MNAILRIFQGTVAFKGEDYECRNMNGLLQKWDSIHTEIETLFDDGLTYGSFRNSKGDWNNTLSAFRCAYKHVGHVPPPIPPVEDP